MNTMELLQKLAEYKIFLQENSLQKLSGGKDNITYSGVLEDETRVVIQCMRSIRDDNHKEFMESAIDFVLERDASLGFAPKVVGLSRFYKGDNCYIQIMQALPGTNATEKEIDDNFIARAAERLALFHNLVTDFPIQNFSKINYHRDRVHIFKEQAENFVETQNNSELDEIIAEFTEKFTRIQLNTTDIRQGVIHGDPVFKNFLQENNVISGWIDYDMMSYTYQLWDLADMYRGYAKMPVFTRKQAQILLENYEKIHMLTPSEKKNLPDFIRMMTLDTGYRYILALDPNSGFYNSLGDSLNKARRCLNDYNRVTEWFD